MLPENRAFFIRGDDGQEYGPVERDELREWVQENRAGLGTAVRRDEPGSAWNPWQNYPELVALLAEVQGTGSVLVGPPGMVIAPIWRRVVAWFMDLILLSFLFFPIKGVLDHFLPTDAILQAAMSASALQTMSPELLHQVLAFELITNACLILYLTGFHAAHGKTPAKAILRIRVVDQNGQKPTLLKALIRAVGLICSINLFFIPLMYAFFNPQKRTAHDFIAGTYVVNA
jgi:uncharacterized RDD family membrane protein YckC